MEKHKVSIKGRMGSLERRLLRLNQRTKKDQKWTKELVRRINEARRQVGKTPLPELERIPISGGKIDLAAAIAEGRRRALVAEFGTRNTGGD